MLIARPPSDLYFQVEGESRCGKTHVCQLAGKKAKRGMQSGKIRIDLGSTNLIPAGSGGFVMDLGVDGLILEHEI